MRFAFKSWEKIKDLEFGVAAVGLRHRFSVKLSTVFAKDRESPQ